MNNSIINYETMAKNMNDLVMADYLIRLTLIAKSVFEWSNLPNGIDEEWIEKYLFSEGKCLFFKDKNRGFMITQLAPDSKMNVYNEPTTVKPYAVDYIGESLTNGKDCVVIKNNGLLVPTSNTIQLYAYKLANLDRTIDVNVEAQKTPIIVECSEKEKLSFRNFLKRRRDNEPVIMVSDKMNTNGIKIHDLKAPVVFKDLELQKHMVWNECMTFLGINNANMDKRERLVDDEVQANNEQVEACFNTMLRERERACKLINKMFDLNISVKKRIQPKPELNEGIVDSIESKKDGDDHDE